ncbi:hypothetical protein LOTGIDRAFT_118238 [Lottia gigantea]|uniref:Amine oxidase n=1 Tax=Lottia gigantea TaxID=225164 RepID=V3ZSM2_LOTGI|nr:hypothetical protein LOTGIDRAFT_118238 [Lottia gigantea]ESO94443.1 hypothetical protein LOTGIDRAFT_118238 [Lottia gigantea]
MIVSILFGLIALGLLVALLVVIFRIGHENPKESDICEGDESIDVSESPDPGVFHDLTKSELRSLQDYLYSDKAKNLNLVRPSKAVTNSSYVYLTDLLPLDKAEVLRYLDNNGPKPLRRARVIIFRGDLSPPIVEEYIVEPFPKPSRHRLFSISTRPDQIPYAYRPVGIVEFSAVYEILVDLDNTLGSILKESYDATISNCGDKCLNFYPHPVSSAISQKDVRKMWFEACHNAPYYMLHPVDFAVLVNVDGSDASKYHIEKIIYHKESFDTAEDLKTKYYDGSMVTKSKIPFPEVNKNLFSNLDYKGDETKKNKRAPLLVEPDGKRYEIKHRQVKYMDWKFDFRMSPLTGPQIYNIMYGNDRIAYEVGLQEIIVFYSGANPATRMTDFVDSGALIGTHSKSLIPGADCPETATFMSASFLSEVTEEPHTNERAFCIFEQNTGVPLKRHLSYAISEGGFYGGVMDNVLILRTILTIVNYDYIFDFIFHQNGAMEVRAVSTGYIYTTFHSPEEDKYGFKLNKNIIGNMHHHNFHFKADLDVLGTSNRYETLDILTEDADNSMWTGIEGDVYNQIYYQRNLKNTERQAAYKFNFDTPKYHIIHNGDKRTRYDAPRAYRIHINGMSKQTLKEDQGNEGTVKWARYQLAVTKYKKDEFGSSSPYKMFDARSPIVDFKTYIDDDENIVDEDLVLWLTMGVHHIPHTEDLPITPTPGAHLSFALLPYNYFDIDPSVHSPDTITVAHKDKAKPEEGVLYRLYSNASRNTCRLHYKDFQSDYISNPDLVLQSKNKKGLF